MDMSLLDAVLGFALAYSATYVLYCWVRADTPARARDSEQTPVRAVRDLTRPRNRSSTTV
ncbi:MAG: hypothetical protein ACM3SS_05075 [Rhodospirillaceae bacterium]